MKHDTDGKAKFRKLVRRLRPSIGSLPVSIELVCVGILERLWHTTIKSAPRGDIGKLEDELIAECVGWHNDPEELINALVDAGWLDRCETHRLVIHDWCDHCPDFLKGNLKRHRQEFAIATYPEQPTKQATREQATEAETPNLTQPNLTQQDAHPNGCVSAGADSPDPSWPAFESSWNRTPGVVPVRKKTAKRNTALRQRLATKGWWEDFLQALQMFPLPFVEDGRSGGWQPTADWILRPDSVARVLEGTYHTRSRDGPRRSTAADLGIDLEDQNEC